jgi:hypothetical protein
MNATKESLKSALNRASRVCRCLCSIYSAAVSGPSFAFGLELFKPPREADNSEPLPSGPCELHEDAASLSLWWLDEAQAKRSGQVSSAAKQQKKSPGRGDGATPLYAPLEQKTNSGVDSTIALLDSFAFRLASSLIRCAHVVKLFVKSRVFQTEQYNEYLLHHRRSGRHYFGRRISWTARLKSILA